MTPYSGGGQLPAEWLTGTYTIKLDGPSHVTYSNVSVNSDFVVTVTAPAQIGMYTLTCAFNGSASYAPVTMTYPHPYTFSALHALGAVQLFSNPTTLAAGQKMDFYVVFHPASGLPMPTGQFSLWFGNSYTNSFTLGSLTRSSSISVRSPRWPRCATSRSSTWGMCSTIGRPSISR